MATKPIALFQYLGHQALVGRLATDLFWIATPDGKFLWANGVSDLHQTMRDNGIETYRKVGAVKRIEQPEGN